MSQTNWEADKMLDVYIHDYLLKRDLKATAQAFQAEGKVSSDPVAIDAPGGFLFEWWSVFWDIFIARTNEKHSEVAASYIETQLMKAREQQQQQQQQQQHQSQLLGPQQPQMQMQQMLMQRHAQLQQQPQQLQQLQVQPQQPQQRREGASASHLMNGSSNGIGEEPIMRQNPGANALATKMYAERLKHPLQRDSLDDDNTKQSFGDNMGQLLDSNQKSLAASGQASGQVLHGTSGMMNSQVQARSQQLQGPAPVDIKPEINPVLTPRAVGSEGSLMGIPGSNQGSNNLTLKGYPLTGGLDHHLRSGLLQQQKPFMQSPQPFHQLQMLSPQHQQQLMLAQNLTQTSSSDENRRLGLLLNNRNMALGKDGPFNSVGDMVPNVGSHLQAGGPLLSRGDHDTLLKLRMAQLQQQQMQPNTTMQQQLQPNTTMQQQLQPNTTMQQQLQPNITMQQQLQPNTTMQQQLQPNTTMQQQLQPNTTMQQQQQQLQPITTMQQQHGLTNQMSQGSNQNIHPQDKLGGAGNMTMEGSMSNSFRGNDQVSKKQTGRKRKQPGSSSGPANSTGTANTAGPSPSSAPSTPSTHTPSDVISMPNLPHSGSSSKPLMMFGPDGTGTLTSPSNQLAEMDRFVEDASLDDNVESFLSHDDIDPRDTIGRCMDISKGFTLTEVNTVRASTSKIVCCHFSSDGKLLASGGHDKKAVLWFTDTLKPKTTLEEHTSMITDVRFSPSMSRLATSSFDKTVRVWDADNPGYTLRTFMGHNETVASLDFHPNKDDLICSCDRDGEIRYWSINNGSCVRVSKGGMTNLRFQPHQGRYLAVAAEKIVSILDVETQACRATLQGHTKPILSISWDSTGDLLASVSEDSVRVWTVGSGSEGDCIHKLSCNGNKFYSCVFHPTCPSTLVIGCYQSMDLWNISENKTMSLAAHEGFVAALAASSVTGLVASVSHDKMVKLWK
ncbi:hypothetical protein SAY86_001741 [Trapa natans]|uniref:Transcriptional corepressor LEUNIG n=1 Tax=Trapa natans TaxID=22666 RepID=A0AAN7LEE3_TRANT|nr:hypothetical protein SAY86_001741 [Trapa natans]